MNDDLLVKYLLQEATPAENRQVEGWIAADATNRRYFEHFKLIWDKSRELAAQSTVNEESAWERFQQRVSTGNTSSQGRVRSLNRGLSGWQVAAMLLLTGAIIAMIYYFNGNAGRDTPVTLAATNTSQVDTLPDGSVITLNRHSSLNYAGAFNKKSRTVELQGEAFFNVTPDKNKPFIVNVNGITVTVTGTSFNIKTQGIKTEVIVETGTVQVSNHKQTIALTPKEKVTVIHPDSVLTKEQETDQLYSYYRNKIFVCDRTPLWKFIQVLNEAYDTHIVIESSEKRSEPYTATFIDQPLDSILNIMAPSMNLTVTRTNSTIILK
jgi:transmembrane sensor